MSEREQKLEAALRSILEAGRDGCYQCHFQDWQCFTEAREALATPPTSEWQPIETAPKYGGRILLARIEDHVWWACTGEWSERWGNWNDGVEPSGLASPNYWMPIPLPPAAIRALKRKE